MSHMFKCFLFSFMLFMGCEGGGTLVGWSLDRPVPVTNICSGVSPVCTVDRTFTCANNMQSCAAPSFELATQQVEAEYGPHTALRRSVFCTPKTGMPIWYLEVATGYRYEVRYYQGGTLIATSTFSDTTNKSGCYWTYWGELPPECCM